jgi:hypothetical protein
MGQYNPPPLSAPMPLNSQKKDSFCFLLWCVYPDIWMVSREGCHKIFLLHFYSLRRCILYRQRKFNPEITPRN